MTSLKSPKLLICFFACLLIVLATAACSRQPKSVGDTPELVIFYNAEEQPSEKSAVTQIIQAQLRQKGIPVRLDPVSNTLYNERLSKGDFQCTLNLWLLDYNDPEGYLTDFYSKAGYRTAKYDNPEYDRLYMAGLLAPTEAEKFRFYKQAVDLLSQELPWVPLYSNNELYLFRQGGEGYVSNAYQYYDYRRVALDSVRAASDVEVQTFDPALAYDTASKHMVTQAYEGLIALDAEARIVPALATSWEFTPKMDKLTFRLRSGVQFHQPPGATWMKPRTMDSGDVRASFERMLKSTSPYTYIFNFVQGVDEFRSGKAAHISGFQAIFAQRSQRQLVQDGSLRSGNLFAFQIGWTFDGGVFDQHDKSFGRAAINTGDFQVYAIGGGKDRRGPAEGMRKINRAGSHRFGLFRTGGDLRIFYGNVVFGKFFLENIGLLFDDGRDIERRFDIGDVDFLGQRSGFGRERRFFGAAVDDDQQHQ